MKCVLTGKISSDLVTDTQTGYVYDKAELAQYLRFNNRCPVTDREITTNDFIEVKGFKDAANQKAENTHITNGQRKENLELREEAKSISKLIARELIKSQLLEQKVKLVEREIKDQKRNIQDIGASGLIGVSNQSISSDILDHSKLIANQRKMVQKGIKNQNLNIDIEEFLNFDVKLLPSSILYIENTESLIYLCNNQAHLRLNFVDLTSKTLITSLQLEFDEQNFISIYKDVYENSFTITIATNSALYRLSFDPILNQFVVNSVFRFEVLQKATKVFRMAEDMYLTFTSTDLFVLNISCNYTTAILHSLMSDIHLAEMHPDGRLMAIVLVNKPNTIILFDLVTMDELTSIDTIIETIVESVLFSNCGYYIAYTCSKHLYIVDLRKNIEVVSMDIQEDRFLGFDHSGLNLLLTQKIAGQQYIALQNIKSGEMSDPIPAPNHNVIHMNLESKVAFTFSTHEQRFSFFLIP